jgi:two-component system KDP operon response regulator KdpE
VAGPNAQIEVNSVFMRFSCVLPDTHLKANVMTPSQPVRVLVVDDEPALRKVILASLAASGFSVEEAGTGTDALDALQLRSFDLVLLDINMPGLGGVETCQRIRALAPHMGIVMVTVRDAEKDKVQALEAGADDYVTKPFRFRELIARMGAVFRRTHIPNGSEAPTLLAGNLKIDFNRRQLWKSGEEIHLSPKEFDLMAFFMKNRGGPLTHARLLRAVWGPEYGGELEYLRSYVRMIRKKIEDDPARPEYLLTEPWVGYRFRNPSDPDASLAAGPSLEDE